MNVTIKILSPDTVVQAEHNINALIKIVSATTHDTPSDGIGAKEITQNGTYYAESEGLEGYNVVNVNVSGGGSSTLIEKTITSNGTYNASSDSADGYSEVTVNVPVPVYTPIEGQYVPLTQGGSRWHIL